MSDALDLIPPGAPLILRDGDRVVLAEQALEGLIRAEAYLRPEPMHCRVPVADILSDTDQRIDQLLFGEAFDVLHRQGERAWGRARRDGVVGWVALNLLSSGAPLATHRVSSVAAALPLNALIGETADGLSEADLQPVGDFEREPVAVAERLLGRPHALGARSSFETDCSGLVQQALLACGLPGPRRSDAQADLGRPIARAAAQRGDLVVWMAPNQDHDWTGHSAIMVDADQVIHATGAHGGVVIEPLSEVEARLTGEGFASAVFRRI
ncbi:MULTISPECIES: C40 family peptidase [unclassified Brevundimonas]|uniref:C40 family peptidase n=1 Tax=unclassified Brevundimonas TaxID=2622653 RepID=UPI0025BEE696|nr:MULTISPECIES: NlpC/P60 family protein [unclassified Brevundimonas]